VCEEFIVALNLEFQWNLFEYFYTIEVDSKTSQLH